MAGSGSGESSGAFLIFELAGLDGHNILPVLEVAIPDEDSDRRAESLAVTNAGDDLHLIALDFHTAASAVALLAAPELMVYGWDIDREACRQAFDDGDKPLAVRLACRGKAKVCHVQPSSSCLL
jgi:hypothetical protein